jgi:hypothetical protein
MTYDEIREGSHYVVDENGCWLWFRAKTVSGYPCLKFNGKTGRVHRVMYAHKTGQPAPPELDHACGRRNCINPDHLEPVTHGENMRRAHPESGRHAEEIRAMYAKGGISQQKIGEKFGIDQTTVSLIVTGKRWVNSDLR